MRISNGKSGRYNLPDFCPIDLDRVSNYYPKFQTSWEFISKITENPIIFFHQEQVKFILYLIDKKSVAGIAFKYSQYTN